MNEVYSSGTTSYTVLEVGAKPETDGQLTLSFLIRAETSSQYELALSDHTFRIDTGGDTHAPTSNLYKTCPETRQHRAPSPSWCQTTRDRPTS